MADPSNPYLPDKLSTLGMMLTGLGSGIGAAASRNLPFYFGVAPGAEAFQNSYNNVVGRGLNYDLARKNYDLNASYKNMQERMIDLQSQALQNKLQMGKELLKQIPGLSGGGAPSNGPGFNVQPPVLGPGSGPTDNNIGNVRPNGQSTGFQTVPDFNSGVALTVNNARAYPKAFNGGQPMSITQIAQRWAPTGDGANDPNAWAFNVSRGSGLDPNQPLDLSNPQIAAQFARGVHLAEKGNKAVRPVSDYLPGASAGAPPQAQPQGAPQPNGMPPMPGPPPNTTGVQVLAGLAGMPEVGTALSGYPNALYKYNVDQYNRQFDAQKYRQSSAQSPVSVGPNGETSTNTALVNAAAEKAAAEEKAKAQAHSEYVFPSGIDDTNKTPDQKLALLPRNIQGIVKEFGPNGDLALSDLPQRMASSGLDPSKIDIVGLTRAVYGDQFDMRQRESQKTFLNNIYDQKTPEGQTRSSLITGIQHINTFAQLVKAQANGDTPTLNAIVKAWNEQTGNPRFSGADALMQFLAPEAAKVVKGSGALNESEVDRNVEQLMNTKSWPQSSTILQTWLGAMLARKNGIEDTARSLGVADNKISRFWGTGPKGPDGKPQPSAMNKAIQEFYAATGGDQVHGPAGQPQQTQSPTLDKMAAPKSKADYDALPKGTVFTAPDGSQRVKP